MGRVVQWSFLLLVGIGLRLSYQKNLEKGLDKRAFLFRNLKRGAFVFACGMIVSLATWLVIPEAYVRFGILHLIGVSIMLLSLIADRPSMALMVSGALFAASFFTQAQDTSVIWLSVLGFPVPGLQTLDYFPILPWMAVPSLGIFLGALYYGNTRQPFFQKGSSGLAPYIKILLWCGRHSLLIYMVHIPVLVGSILLLHAIL